MAPTPVATDGFITANGLRLHYLDWGPPHAPPVVLLHGLRGSARTWEPLVTALDPRYRRLALDLRGRGESDWDPAQNYTVGAYVADLEQLVEQLDLRSCILVGHSMGGATGLVYAARHPEQVRAVVVEDIGPPADPPVPGYARIGRELDATPDGFASWDAAMAAMRRQRPGADEETLQRVVQTSLNRLADGRMVWKYDLAGIRRLWAGRRLEQAADILWKAVEGLHCPTLLLRGERSDMLPAEVATAMSVANPALQWQEIPGASHFVHDDNPLAFHEAVGQFLASLD
jgi:pimeloyl-ACP methyl ester carboxylesterase